ncbi:MAG: hypothetical protein FWB93_03175, partial [Oscillospiraceae bacterium]|nr:hypothetical protein [Oscillospiraceae bacterium]
MGNVAGTFFTIIGLILITACITAMKDSFKSEGAGKIIEWATVIITAVIVYTAAFSQFALLQDMLTRLHGLLTGLLPFITALNIASGSVTTAAVTGVQITLVLAIISSIAYYALLPILQVCFGLNLTSHVSKSHGLTLISDFVRNGFLFLIGGITAVLGIIFAFQANVAQSADTVALRTMKFAAGSWIPVVGSSVSEALRTVMGSLNLIRSTTGAIGIVSVLMIGLPTILSLAAAKLSFTFAAGIAEMLSCGDVAKMLGGVNKLLNFAIAIAVIFNVMTIFSLGVFMGSVG